MAYGELYRVNFFDTDEHKFLLQIFEDGYSGLVSDNLTLGDNPVVVSYQQDDNFFNPIIGSSCKLQFYVEEGTGGGVWNLEETNWNLANFYGTQKVVLIFLNLLMIENLKLYCQVETLLAQQHQQALLVF